MPEEEQKQPEETQPQNQEAQKDDSKDWKAEAEKWKAHSREWEARSKENKSAADELAKLKEDQKSEEQKLLERAEKAEKKVEAYERAHQIDEWKAQAAKETGVNASILRGSTLEEIEEHAKEIKAAMSNFTPVNQGTPAQPKLSKQQILDIKDPKERKAQIAQHLDLF